MMAARQLGKPIAEGRTAEIYSWDDGQILKLYRTWCPGHWVDVEARIAHIVCGAELAAPAAGDIVEVEGRRGIIYERVDGPSMLSAMQNRWWTVRQAGRQMAELQAAIHNCSVPDLPSYRHGMVRDIRSTTDLPDNLKESVLQMLEAMPDAGALCHGDLHPGNIIMTTRGPIVIDWMTARRGHPLADVARTLLLCSTGTPPNAGLVRYLLPLVRRVFLPAYCERYFELRPHDRELLARWQPIIAAARMNEGIAGEREWLLAQIERGIQAMNTASRRTTTQ
jgi:Ser/Thr protein kinase RdoA (MazF antagonist)